MRAPLYSGNSVRHIGILARRENIRASPKDQREAYCAAGVGVGVAAAGAVAGVGAGVA